MMRKTCVKLFFYHYPHKSGCKDVKNHHNKKEKPLIQYHSSMSHYSLFWTFWQVLTTLSKASHFSWLHFVYCHQRNQHQLPLIHTAMLNTDSGSLYHFQDPKSKKKKVQYSPKYNGAKLQGHKLVSYGFRWKILKPIAMESVEIYLLHHKLLIYLIDLESLC